MTKDKMEIIQELMDMLKDEMQYGKDDFEERLGRKKPDMAIMKVEGDLEPDEEKMGMDLDGDDEMGESPEHAKMVMGADDEDEDLKSRLMKMRG